MYDYITGNLTYKNESVKGNNITVENNGIGYYVEITKRDYISLDSLNSDLRIYISLLHREDKMSLCGFLKREDRDLYNVLTSVSGVGPKMALALLDSFSTSDLIRFVLDEDYKSIMIAKGVGQKLAQKIILELKGKISESKYNNKTTTDNKADYSVVALNDAKMVLQSLGYEDKEINSALENALNIIPNTSSAEDILKKTLQILSV